MEKVEHRILSLAIFIACRSVDGHTAQRTSELRARVPLLRNCSVRSVMDLIPIALVALGCTDGEVVDPSRYVPLEIYVGGIHGLLPVDKETVGI